MIKYNKKEKKIERVSELEEFVDNYVSMYFDIYDILVNRFPYFVLAILSAPLSIPLWIICYIIMWCNTYKVVKR